MKHLVTIALICIFAAGCGINDQRGIDCFKLVRAEKKPYITAHRGCSNAAPENTIPAINIAIEAGVDFIEIDVRETKDGVPVLLHDENLVRTCGINKNIWDVYWDEIRKIDIGCMYSPKYNGTRIPKLDDVLKEVDGKIKINIEIKTDWRGYGIVEKVVDLIEKYDVVDKCLVTCREIDAIIRAKNKNNRIKTGLIIYNSVPDMKPNRFLNLYSIHIGLLAPETLDKAHYYGKEVHVWTVNNKQDMAKCITFGVDNIITDYPDRLANIIHSCPYSVPKK